MAAMNEDEEFEFRLRAEREAATSVAKPKLTPEQISAHMKKAAVSSARAENPILAGLADLGSGATSIIRGGVGLVSPELSEKLWPQDVVNKDSGLYLAGQIADPAAMAIGGGAMNVAKAAKAIPKIGSYIAKRPVVEGMLGGGIAGTTIGALDADSNATESGLLGTAIGGAIPVVGRAVGKVVDFAQGKSTDLRAKKLIEEVAGKDLPKMRAAWQQAPSDLTASQAVADVGSTRMAALGDRAATNMSQDYSDIARAQALARRNEVARVAGGQTQAEANLAAKQAKKSLNAVTTPMRDIELDAVREASKKTQAFTKEAEQMEGMATNKVQDVRRFTEAEKRAFDLSNNKFTVEGYPRVPGKYTYERELSEMAAKVTDDAAKQSLLYGEAGRLARAKLESLEAHGLRQLDTDGLMRKVTESLDNTGVAGNRASETALDFVSQSIKKWTEKGGGVIDPRALYEIRKNAVNSAIESLMSGSSNEAKKRAAAGIMKSIKPHFDDAIEKAGGTGWRDYLKTYEEGMNVVNRMKLGAKAMDMLDNNPKNFVKLINNNKPKEVSKLFTQTEDIAEAMAEQYAPLRKAASAMERDTELAKRAAEGKSDLAVLLAKDAGLKWMPQLVNWKVAAARKAGDIVEEKLNQVTMNKVYAAMKSGKDVEKILSLIPASERNLFLSAMARNKATPYAMGVTKTQGEEQ